jgi:hypothetical protein
MSGNIKKSCLFGRLKSFDGFLLFEGHDDKHPWTWKKLEPFPEVQRYPQRKLSAN